MGLDYRTKVILGLDNVDNTSDINKPVSTAQQEAINNAVAGKIDSDGDIGSTHIGNADTTISRDADGNMIFQDGNTPAVKLQEIDCPKLIWLQSKTLTHNTLASLNDASAWNTNKSLLQHIKIETTSTDWDLVLYCSADETNGIFQNLTIMKNASGNKMIPLLGLPYADYSETGNLYLKFIVNSGPTTTATATILAIKAR